MKIRLTKEAIKVIRGFSVRPFAKMTGVKYQSLYTYINLKAGPSFKNRSRILKGVKTVWDDAEFDNIFRFKSSSKKITTNNK